MDAPQAGSSGRGETVLVVEDDTTVRLLVIEVLEELGYAGLEAGHAQAAVPIIQSRQRIDLLVTDVGLPNMNGRQLAEIVRHDPICASSSSPATPSRRPTAAASLSPAWT